MWFVDKESLWKKRGFLEMIFGILAASLLENVLPDKGVIGAGEETIRAG